jgi:hypothetical protein
MHLLTGTEQALLPWIAGGLFTILGYAETHFRIPGMPSRIYKNHPEIILDLPFRTLYGERVPLFLIIKDADRFPINIISANVFVQSLDYDDEPQSEKIEINTVVRNNYHDRIFWLPKSLFPTDGRYEVYVTLNYRTADGKTFQIQQDNYNGKKHPFHIYISNDKLPKLPYLHWGDIHIHSNYTDDIVEFGASIAATATCAETVGLSFLAITDHSFDFDYVASDGKCAEPTSQKWQRYLQELEKCRKNFPNLTILSGEEVSIGNHRGQNIHCLVLGNRHFYPGNGDGANPIFRNRPTMKLTDFVQVVQQKDPAALIIAAHPFDKPPLSQKILLNRGNWKTKDLTHPNLTGWQLLNGRQDKHFHHGIQFWVKRLLKGEKISIYAGTDAHGNFNLFRQIKLPLISMIVNRQQLLGLTKTGIFSVEAPSNDTVLNSMRRRNCIISTGPAALLSITANGQTYMMGDELNISNLQDITINVHAVSTREYGEFSAVILSYGHKNQRKELMQSLTTSSNQYTFKNTIPFPENISEGYVRLTVSTRNEHNQHFFCYTNPIWINKVN